MYDRSRGKCLKEEYALKNSESAFTLAYVGVALGHRKQVLDALESVLGSEDRESLQGLQDEELVNALKDFAGVSWDRNMIRFLDCACKNNAYST